MLLFDASKIFHNQWSLKIHERSFFTPCTAGFKHYPHTNFTNQTMGNINARIGTAATKAKQHAPTIAARNISRQTKTV